MSFIDTIREVFSRKPSQPQAKTPTVISCGCKEKEMIDVRVFTPNIENNFNARYCKDHIKAEVEKGNLVAI